MSDIARPRPPGQELAHGGNVGGAAPKPAGQELSTLRNQHLATIYKDLAQ
jgi:hypothetical protein